jgi:hypothetical protein
MLPELVVAASSSAAPLLSIGCCSDSSLTISPISVCSACATVQAIGWSDIPCQGDDLLHHPDAELSSRILPLPYVAQDRALLLEASLSSSSYNGTTSPPRMTHSPRSSIVEDLALLADETSASGKSGKKKRVSFSPVLQIRTHNVILSDHPCCVGGMALQLGWDSTEDDELVDLDTHEEAHSPKRRMHQMHLSYSSRRARLQQLSGLSGAELLQEEYSLRCSSEDSAPSDDTVLRRVLKHAPSLQQLSAASAVV